MVFSKEKQESENLNALRLRSLLKAILVNTVFLLFSIIFVFGGGFVAVLVFNLVSLQLFYLVFFYFARRHSP
jgi:Zn-dependent protease with chaperone function